MTTSSKTALVFVLSVFLSLPIAARAYDEPSRTANRTVEGNIVYPDSITSKPPYYEFLPYTSNWDPQNSMPAEWQIEGQDGDWDTSQWDKSWTPEIALKKFYQARIFTREYMDRRTPVIEVGPAFYKLSDLDQRRTLKLLVDTRGVFTRLGYSAIMLADWRTHRAVGIYTQAKGMQLD